MKRLVVSAVVVWAMIFVTSPAKVFAQNTFSIPYKFQAAGTTLTKGEYSVIPKDENHITLRQEATGKEFQVAFTKRIPQPNPAVSEPQIVFDEVGNFAPSYTEYVTDYVLAEVWLPGSDGYLVHSMKGAHKTQVVKAQKKQ